MRAPPPIPNASPAESPIETSLGLSLSGQREPALRWGAAALRSDPSIPSALLAAARAFAELGSADPARRAATLAVKRAIDVSNLPLAVAAAGEIARAGGDAGPALDAIAAAFCKGSPRLTGKQAP